MPTKKSNPEKRSTSKAKPTARAAAAERVATRPRAPQGARPGRSEKERSQGRFPGETPLTGEDRPADRAGGKKRGQGTGGRGRNLSR
jgi:hypothetical protein